MRSITAWIWSIISIAVILLELSLGVFGPEGRALSRQFFVPVVSISLVTTLFSYLQQNMRPTRKLWLINVATVIVIAHITIPFWHFGVVLPTEPNGAPAVRWWVNGVVLVAAFVVYWILSLATRPLEPGPAAIEDKQERLTI